MLFGYERSHTVSRHQHIERDPIVRDFVYDDAGHRITMQVIIPESLSELFNTHQDLSTNS